MWIARGLSDDASFSNPSREWEITGFPARNFASFNVTSDLICMLLLYSFSLGSGRPVFFFFIPSLLPSPIGQSESMRDTIKYRVAQDLTREVSLYVCLRVPRFEMSVCVPYSLEEVNYCNV